MLFHCTAPQKYSQNVQFRGILHRRFIIVGHVIEIETMLQFRIAHFLLAASLAGATAQALDLKNAVIVSAGSAAVPVQKASQMLREEIEKRTEVRLEPVHMMPGTGQAAIVIGTTSQVQSMTRDAARLLPAAPQGPDGFRIAVN